MLPNFNPEKRGITAYETFEAEIELLCTTQINCNNSLVTRQDLSLVANNRPGMTPLSNPGSNLIIYDEKDNYLEPKI
jgi:hypothetical protein